MQFFDWKQNSNKKFNASKEKICTRIASNESGAMKYLFHFLKIDTLERYKSVVLNFGRSLIVFISFEINWSGWSWDDALRAYVDSTLRSATVEVRREEKLQFFFYFNILFYLHYDMIYFFKVHTIVCCFGRWSKREFCVLGNYVLLLLKNRQERTDSENNNTSKCIK